MIDAVSLTTDRRDGDDEAEYHIQLVAILDDSETPVSFRTDIQYGKSYSKKNVKTGSPTAYNTARRQFNERREEKLNSTGARVYIESNFQQLPNGKRLADPTLARKIIDSATGRAIPTAPSTGPDKKMLAAVSDPKYVGVATPNGLVKIVCDEQHVTAADGRSLPPAVVEDARVIGRGFEILGYVDGDSFLVADVVDVRYPEKILGARLQTLQALIGTLDLEHIALCKFAVNEQMKRDLLDASSKAQNVVAFIRADATTARQTYLYHPNQI